MDNIDHTNVQKLCYKYRKAHNSVAIQFFYLVTSELPSTFANRDLFVSSRITDQQRQC